MNRYVLFFFKAWYSNRIISLCMMVIIALSCANISGSTAQLHADSKSTSDSTSIPEDFKGNPSKGKKVKPPQLTESYGKLPLSFEKNTGQTDSRVKFLSRGSGYSIFLTQTEAVLVLREPDPNAGLNKKTAQNHASYLAPVDSPTSTSKSSVLNMRLVGANSKAQAVGSDPLPAKSNYFIGNNPKNWLTEITNYGKVQFRNAYPGIDLVYYGSQRQLEYDFIVAPGADPRVINIVFDGAQSLEIDKNGDLLIKTFSGVIRHHKPVVYQEKEGKKTPVSAHYILKSGNQIGIALGVYDKTQKLFIDPVLSYSTFLGGSSRDVGYGIAVDNSGNAYITGFTGSLNFPVTAGVFQPTRNQLSEGFIAKLNSSGTALVYSTYLGGNGGDAGYDIALDANGNAYVTGITSSSDFPTTPGAFQLTKAGLIDSFVTKLNASGSALIYSTYVGGGGEEYAAAIAVDAQGNAHCTGTIIEGNFPVTPGAFQTTFRGGYEDPSEWGDAYVYKLNASGTALIYATYLGGTDSENGVDIKIDSEGYACVIGSTNSTDFPVSSNAYQKHLGTTSSPARASNWADIFVTKFNLTGTGIIFSTYIGGNLGDNAGGIAIDAANNIFIAGSTNSTTYPIVNALQTSFAGYSDAVVTKLNASGSAVLFSTYLGKSDLDDAVNIGLDAMGNAYVMGYTYSADFPMVNPIQANFAGSSDVFVAKINPTIPALTYSTYLGGSSFEGLLYGDIAVDSTGNAYITGVTTSHDFPTTPMAYQKVYGDADDSFARGDAFVAKISDTPPYDLCLQDDGNGNRLQINSATGEYQFTNCSGFTLGGIGTLTRNRNGIVLQHNTSDRRMMVTIDINMKRATGSLQVLSQGRLLTLTDRNILNNNCSCN